jgi:hypothetical protein
MHGVQPKAKAMPRGTAPVGPERMRRRSTRRSRYRNGTRSHPSVAAPSTMTTMPASLTSRGSRPRRNDPRIEALAPSAVNTIANPSTNRPAAPRTRRRDLASPAPTPLM